VGKDLQSEITARIGEHSRSTGRAGGYVRLSVNLSPTVADALRQLTERHGSSITEEVRRALSIWKFIDDQRSEGGEILIERKDGKVRQLVL
jgi:hypothetical protein